MQYNGISTTRQTFHNLKKRKGIQVNGRCDNKQIEAHEKGVGTDGTLMQLKQILAEVLKMKKVMSATKYKPYYPRIIVDSWDDQSELGSKLLDLALEYEKLN